MKNKNINLNTQRACGIAIFSALAYVVAFVCNIIPPVAGFLSLDVKDAIITVAAFAYGPISALIISFIAALIELVTFSTTGWYGFVMNFISSSVFSVTASLIYSKRRSLNGALIGLYSAVMATTAVMLLMNLIVTPWYLVYIGLPIAVARGEVMTLLPIVLLPFNFSKALLNSATVMLLYKPLTLALSRIGIGAKSKGSIKWGKSSYIILGAGLASATVALAILLVLWL